MTELTAHRRATWYRQAELVTLLASVLLLTGYGCSEAGAIKDEERQTKKPRPTNRLIDETSPYLLLHAHNPVDWYPWGDEAFQKAKGEGKLIFLSIGYSSCYWCHVMEREVFSNAEIAALMNEQFVCIKVDREERPDIDEAYMSALNLYYQLTGSGGSGGWPLSMFLTAEGKPIAGGTYFPPEDRAGMIGFPTLLKRVHELWRDRRADIEKQADELAGFVRRAMVPARPLKRVELSEALVQQAVAEVIEAYDPAYGGFNADLENAQKPKFPEPAKLFLLLQQEGHTEAAKALEVLRGTLDAMAAGGIRDHLGGGFHRYSTDRYWRVPHFEKMLYDNAQLADLYVQAYRVTKHPEYRRVGEEIFAFIEREMTGPQGGFYSALDAESEGEEGKYYVWTAAEIESALGAEDAKLFGLLYGISEGPNFENEANVLLGSRMPEEVADEFQLSPEQCRAKVREMRQRLLQMRAQRARPLLDDKMLSGWNGLMIRALADAGAILEEPRYTAAAARSADFLLQKMRGSEGQLLRSYRNGSAKIPGYLDDYAFFIEGLLALHEATREPRWLNEAVDLSERCLQGFSDEQQASFYFSSDRHEELFVRSKDVYDSVLPSGNSVMANNLLRLAEQTGKDEYRQRAVVLMQSFAPLLAEEPAGLPNMARALERWLKQR